ncbi:MAG: hypothetical protein IPN67_06500 [Bacteroidales bacterium]|nr:hypothetical protein [Bacteroidales bacterium]
MRSFTFNIFSVIFLLTQFFTDALGETVIYPAPPGLKTSPDFTVSADNQEVWVERIGSKYASFEYDLYGSREMEDLNVASFSCSGLITIVIRANVNIEKINIRPKNRNIKATINGQEIRFTISGPQKLYIEINNLPHLAIFANPLEVNPRKKGDPGVIYYGPGVHNPGRIYLVNNMTLYIAGGAIVNADIFGKNLKNITIAGRGILQGKVEITGCTNFNVEGIFIRNTRGWSNTLTDCHNSGYRNVKVFSYEAIYSVDGINPVSCTNFIIDDCFMRCRDDCVAIKSGDINLRVDSVFISNCVMVGWACSDGITIGFELNGGPVENIFVKNCDILYARGDGKTKGHAAFSIVCDGPAIVRNIFFEDIRVEEQVEFKNLELIVTDGTLYGADPPGHIKGVRMKNVQWENNTKPFIITGYSPDNMVEDIVFDKCSAGGKIITGMSDADIRTNSFVKDIKFNP